MSEEVLSYLHGAAGEFYDSGIGKSKLSKNVLFNASKHVFHCENSLRTLFCGQPSY
jgi:hypothetical protein